MVINESVLGTDSCVAYMNFKESKATVQIQ